MPYLTRLPSPQRDVIKHPPEKPNLSIVQITMLALNSYLGYIPRAEASTAVKVMGGTGGFLTEEMDSTPVA